MRHYFAYAINMDEHAMRRRCPTARPIGRARLPGHKFVITRDGYASVVRRPGAQVHGLVWLIGRADERALDEFEALAQRQYRKGHLRVRPDGGGWIGCMAYLANNPDHGRPVPGYLDGVVAAAERHRLPQPYIQELRRWGLEGTSPAEAPNSVR